MRDLIGIDDLDRGEIESVLDLAAEMEVLREMGSDLCKGKILATIFYEPSTRTRLSFESAMLRLGGEVLGFADPQTTSVAKDETLADTVHMVCNYSDIIVMRHSKAGAARLAAQHSVVPIVNAGDDAHQHPTQSLTDLFTIRRLRGDISELTVGICGDLRFGRAAHSLAYALAMFGARIVLIAPTGLELPEDVSWRLDNLYGANTSLAETPRDVIGELDVLYVNRLQKERLPAELDANAIKDVARSYRVDADLMKLAKPDCLVMHPLPRVDELTHDLDDDPRAAYFQQSSNGVPVRMALMAMLLRRVDRPAFREKPRRVTEPSEHVCANPACVTQAEPRVRPLVETVDAARGVKWCAYCRYLLPDASGS
ncbi:aspartate carbamoyltransferase [Candidatus Poribacteria bacterium]|nr:aspartate carbamoyltransferase [Candidatus Poribacteria bacterium]